MRDSIVGSSPRFLVAAGLFACAVAHGGCGPEGGTLRVIASPEGGGGAVPTEASLVVRRPSGDERREVLSRDATGWSGRVERLAPGEPLEVQVEGRDALGALVARGQAREVTVSFEREALLVVALRDPTATTEGAPLAALWASPAQPAPGERVELRALGADATASASSYLWSADVGQLADPAAQKTTWLAPPAELRARLRVVARASIFLPQSLDVLLAVTTKGWASVTAAFNNWPVVQSLVATPGRVSAGETLSLTLTARDTDGDPLGASWSDGCGGMFDAASGVTSASWTAPAAGPSGGVCTLVARLTDGRGGEATGSVTVVVGPPPNPNTAPLVVGTYQSQEVVAPGDTVTFRAKAEDAEGDALTYDWRATGGTLATPTLGAQGSEVSWTAPAGGCGYSVRITIADARGAAVSHRFRVRCASCGNGTLEAGEACDGAGPAGRSCAGEGFAVGRLACTEVCTLDTTGCRRLASVPSGTTASLRSVGGGLSRVWAVGQGGRIVRLDGATVQPVASPVTSLLRSVWGAGVGSGWAVGDGGVVLRFDGAVWRSAGPSGTANALFSVTGSDDANRWAVGGGGTVLRGNGASWAPVSSGTGKRLEAAWTSAPAELWACGADGTVLRGGPAGLVTLRGGVTGQTLSGLWGSDATNVWAVGAAGAILRFDGQSFATVSSGTTTALRSVWGAGPSELWAVGAGGTVLWLDGANATAVPSGTTQTLNGVWGRGPTEVWIVGDRGTVLRVHAGTND